MSNTRTSTLPDAELDRDESSRLCLECGLCCKGFLHKDAVLVEEEIAKARRHGLEVVHPQPKDGPCFSLPCHVFDTRNNRCSIYEDRFAVCKRYKCHLLRRLEAGSIDFDHALTTVRRVQSMRRRLKATVDSSPDRSGENRDPEMLLDVAALSILAKREFVPPTED